MGSPHGDVADVVRSLTPLARWFAVVSAMVGLIFWSYSALPWPRWPWPARWAVIMWCSFASVGPVYLFVVGIVSTKVWHRQQVAKGAPANKRLVPEIDEAGEVETSPGERSAA